jgi:uncharacterized protein
MSKPKYRRLADGSTMLMHDGFQNVVANLGTPRDKAFSGSYYTRVHSSAELLNAYRSAWLPRKIVDIIPMDATRRWRAWQADKDQISAIEAEEKRLGLVGKIRDAMVSARLYGGAVVYISNGDIDVENPLDQRRIKKGGIKHLTVIGRDYISPGQRSTDADSAQFGKPEWYDVSGKKIHPSRLVVLTGSPLPAGSPVVEMWGDSVLAAMFDAIQQADSTAANIASMTYEAIVDVLRIPNLMEMLKQDGGDAKLSKYLTTLAMAKGNNGMLILDGGGTIQGSDKRDVGTEYDRKPITFGGLGDIWDRAMQAVSGAADIPMTRLFGMAAAGLNATGEGDAQNYAAKIAAMQSLEIEPEMSILDECLIRSALGDRPEEIHFNWRPIYEPTDAEKALLGKTTAEIITALGATGLFLEEVLAEAGANAMIETGALPGLEAAVEKYGIGIDGDEEDEIAAEVAAGAAQDMADAAARTLYVKRNVMNADDLISWAKSQGFKSTLPADDLHVTVAFSRTPLDWMKVGESWEETIEVPAGGPRLMEKFGEARVLLFSSGSLKYRHEQIIEAGASWDHPEYQPHITISYGADAPDLADIEPYTGKIILGPEVFAEVDLGWSEKIVEE